MSRDRDYTGNKQRQVIQTFIFLYSGKGGQRGSGECVGYLRLGGFNERSVSGDFHRRVGFANSQFHQAKAAVTRRYQNVVLDGGFKALAETSIL